MDLIVECFGNTTNLVDRFESYDEYGAKLYQRLIILEAFKNYRMHPEYRFGLILERVLDPIDTVLTISSLKKYGLFQPIILENFTRRLKITESDHIDISLPPDKHISIQAQCSLDRKGFYKLYDQHNHLISQKKYGDCSYYYKIVGFRISKKVGYGIPISSYTQYPVKFE